MVVVSCVVFLLLIGCIDCQSTNINVGVLMPKNLGIIDTFVGYNVSAGTLMAAVDRAIALEILNPSLINITFSWHFDQCDESLSAGYAANLIHDNHVSAILGPTSAESSFVVGALAKYKNIPVFLWGPASPIQFSPRVNYITTLPFAGSVRGTFSSMSYLVSQFNWTKLAFVYTELDDINQGFSTCKYFAESFESQSDASANISETYIRHALNNTVDGFRTILNSVNNRARIIVSCLETQSEKRNYMKAALANKMTTVEYVHIFIQVTSIGFGDPPFWVGNDGLDNQIKEAAKTVLIVDKYLNTTERNSTLLEDIYKNIFAWPFYCKECSKNGSASNLAIYLGDALLVYLLLLNRTYTKYEGPSQLKNTTAVLEQFAVSEEVPSILGNTYRLAAGVRVAKYNVIGLDLNGNPTMFAMVDSGYIPSFSNDTSSIWATRGGFMPTSVPRCGFSNELCPQSPIFYTIIVVGSIVAFICVVGLLGISVYFFQRQQRKRLNSLWQIHHGYLVKNEEKNSQMTKSRRSVNSTNTDSSRSTVVLRKNTDHTEFVYFNQQIVVARKHTYLGRWSENEESEFRKMRATDHTNLNKFLGVSLMGSACLTLWECCSRGNIIEVIKQHAYRMDGYIMTAMIRNLIEGLFFIHNSRFVQHGCLDAYKCVVGDRFDVKIQLYGLSGLKSKTYRRLDTLSALYVAPEHLHGQQTEVGSQAGDIYSLAVICSTILNMKPAYGCEEADDESSEIVRSIARGKYPPVRPTFDIDASMDVNSELLSLVKKCWAEHPPERPKIGDIREIMLRNISTTRSSNLMDYMFSIMESSAAELEKDVQQRTLELLEEQKKADILLYRMMPRDAADNLKLGQTVAPEVYESATVFFSDIVSFTVLASKSTPLQIISFLNDTYTLADSVIDKFDVYKVETIGDGMHVVSGVPKRNGNNHVKEISDMAVDFQRAVKTLRMPHLPDHQVQMRVGITSGPCVAGIVGITNPRYIVFGDTVNIAAKMEASGRAGRIHISSTTKNLLFTHFPNKYNIFDRGETLIKGIGAIQSHWLVAPEDINGFQL